MPNIYGSYEDISGGSGSVYQSQRDPKHDSYELHKFKRNLLIIFNHIHFSKYSSTRIGTENDERTLQNTFEPLNFECVIYRDMSAFDMLNHMKNFGEKDFTDYGCVFVVVMTHGDDRGLLHSYDGKYSEHDLVQYLCENPTLIDKPVVFIIQATRGVGGMDLDVPIMSFFDDDFNHRIKSDLLIFYSSPIGQPSFRGQNGSFFIQALCKQIHLLAHIEDFESICRAVRREFALNIDVQILVRGQMRMVKQKPMVMTMLIRRLYLGNRISMVYEATQSRPTFSVDVCYPDLNAPTYVLGKNNKNLMIIFNHENFLHNTRREGSAADAENLKSTFEQFGFEVTTHKDENMADMFDKLTKFSRQDFGACGCVCVAVLTHGSAHGFLEACDVGYSERALFAAFDALANRSLAGKPLVFLIQASRGAQPASRICVPRLGERPESSIQLDCAGDSKTTYQIKYLPTEANMIIFHSCFRGRAVPNDERGGSCFVRTLCDVVRRRGAGEHLEKMFRRVRRLVAEAAPQMPVVTSTLLKKLYLKRSQPAPA